VPRKFADALSQLTNGKGKIGLAVSGGPDSLALLLFAHDHCPDRIMAATVDHGLRVEAADEARFVATICAERSIPHSILKPSVPITGNIQSSARNARYALLEDWATREGCDWIATAHHADDQLETVLMRLIRGSGVDGLSGIRSTYGRIIRPLLSFTKSELIAICQTAGIVPVQDPSNDSTDFDRVRIRQYLAAAPHPFDPLAAGKSAAALADASAALDWMTGRLACDRITLSETGIILNPSDLPRELLRRLLHIALRQIDPEIAPRGDSIERGLDALNANQTITLGNILCKGGVYWHLSPAPPRRNG
jgi:tRNA(Ile)-lysidine synthase